MNERYLLDRLRRRIDEIEQRHAQDIKSLRSELEQFESRDADDPDTTAGQPPPLPDEPPQRSDPQPASVTPPAETSAPPAKSTPEPDPPPSTASTARADFPQPASAETTPATQREKTSPAALEMDLGRVWLVRVGVVILLTGLVFLGNYAYQNWIRDISNGLRLTALFALSGVWVEAGRRITQRENLQRFGEVVMAGGLGFFYYCVYASHHVDRLRVIDNPLLAGILLVVAAVVIAAVAWRRESKIMATMSMMLASYTTVVQPLGWLACVANSALAGMGLAFLTRRGWAAPGWVAMLGMYFAFALWQVLGAAGEGSDRLATLWFLAPSWLVFAVTGVTPHAGAALSDRARAWFAGANNGLFFLLFGTLWLLHHGGKDFWMVVGVLGLIWIGFGIYARRVLPVAGSVNLSQGLLLLGLCGILKLDGYHIPLAFAIEALALAVAYHRFGGRVEAVFSLLAGIVAALWLWGANEPPPVWSIVVMLGPLGAATWIMRRAAGFDRRRRFRVFARFAAAGLFWSGWVVFVIGAIWRIDANSATLASAVAALLLGWAALRIDLKRRMRELAWGALAMLAVAMARLLEVGLIQSIDTSILLIAVTVHLAGAWLWRTNRKGANLTLGNPRDDRRLNEWLHAILAGLGIWMVCEHYDVRNEFQFLATMAAAWGLAVAAIFTRSGRLAIVAGLLSLGAVAIAWPAHDLDSGEARAFLFATPIALAALPCWFALPAGARVPRFGRVTGSFFCRTAAFFAWMLAIYHFGDRYALDGWAATMIVLTLATLIVRIKIPFEAMAFLGIAALSLWIDTIFITQWSHMDSPDSWRGVGVVAALLLLVTTHRQRVAVIKDANQRRHVIAILACLAWVFAALWATQMLVWRMGWDGCVILWSTLGLLTVMIGLWQHLRSLRLAGLLLLVVALAKLFAIDVWDFTAFTRVMSFIALGIALILLGWFYNYCAATLKKWL